jgi:hypothetical protein
MADIHATPEAIREHAADVRRIGAGVLDGAAAGIRSVPDLNFGVIPGPVIYPPMLPLFTQIEAAVTVLAAVAGDISLGLSGVAEVYEVAEDVAKKLVTKAGG